MKKLMIVLIVFSIFLPFSNSRTQEIEYIGSIDLPNWAADVFSVQSYAFVANARNGLKIIDVSNPSTPIIVGEIAVPGDPISVFLHGQYAFLAAYIHGLQIVDISNPEEPFIIGHGNHLYAQDVFVKNDLAFVSGERFTFGIYDISDIANPVRLGGWQGWIDPDNPNYAWDSAVWVDSNFAYVGFIIPYGSPDPRLKIFDITDPTNPLEISNIFKSTNAIFIEDDYIFISGSGLLSIFDISDPENPQFLGEYTCAGLAWDIFAKEGLAYISNGLSGIEIVDVTNPTDISFVAAYDTPDDAWGLNLAGDYIYVADKHSLQILSYAQTKLDDEIISAPASYGLAQNYPNPFNAQTTIQYDLPEQSDVIIDIFDIMGCKIETLAWAVQSAGSHTVVWNARNASSGIYFYCLKTDNFSEVKSMILLK